MRFLASVLLFVIISFESVQAQSFYAVRRPRNLIVMGGTGTTHYKGDLQDPGKLAKTRFNILAGAEYFFLPRISARAELAYFRLAGSDAVSSDPERRDRNLSFFSDNIELSTVATVSLLKTPKAFYQRPLLNLYGFGGIGLLFFNPKTERDNGEKVALQPIRTEGVYYSRFQPVIMGGAGIKYQYNPLVNIVLEVGYRLSFTDHLDDVAASRYHGDPRADYVLTDPLAIELNKRATGPASVRGNPANNDGYLLMNVKVQYYLKKEIFAGSQKNLYNKKRKWYYRNR
jgi:opacity protein-like surface antigen